MSEEDVVHDGAFVGCETPEKSVYDEPFPISEPYAPVAKYLLRDARKFKPRGVIVRECGVKSYVGASRIPDMHIEPETMDTPLTQIAVGSNIKEVGICETLPEIANGISWKDTIARTAPESRWRQLDHILFTFMQLVTPKHHRHFVTDWMQPHHVNQAIADLEAHELRKDLVIVCHPNILRFLKGWPFGHIEWVPDYRTCINPSDPNPPLRGYLLPQHIPIYTSTMCPHHLLLVVSPRYAGFLSATDDPEKNLLTFSACFVNDYAIAGVTVMSEHGMGWVKVDGDDLSEPYWEYRRCKQFEETLALSYENEGGWNVGWIEKRGYKHKNKSVQITWDPPEPEPKEGDKKPLVEKNLSE